MKAAYLCYSMLLMILLTGCSVTSTGIEGHDNAGNQMTPNVDDLTTLITTKWRLLSIQDKPLSKGSGGKPAQLVFDQTSNKISGFSGCNNYFGSYVIENSSLTFSHLAMTRKACKTGMQLEADFSKMMSKVASYAFENRQLKLFDRNAKLLATFSE